MEQRGLFDLKADLREVISYVSKAPYPIYINDVLSHTAGLKDYVTASGVPVNTSAVAGASLTQNCYFGMDVARQVIAEVIGGQGEPDHVHRYSNAGYILLADMLEGALNQSLNDIVGEHVFTPLGMASTAYDTNRLATFEKRASGYKNDLQNLGRYLTCFKNFDVCGDIGILTSVGDLIKWEQNWLDDKLASGHIISQLEASAQIRRREGNYAGFGVDRFVADGITYFYHGGRTDGNQSHLIRVPEKKLSVIFLSNCSTPTFNVNKAVRLLFK